MLKYDIKLIDDYINGNDISGYDLEELENDFKFMYLVFEKTNDKKMYHYCSEELKKDFRLVKYLINKFRDDIDFICLVADNFSELNDDEIEFMELLIIMDMYTSKHQKQNMVYKLKLSLIYSNEISKIRCVLDEDEELREELGEGFYVIYDKFCSSKIVTNYFAKRMINNLLTDNVISLEEYLHNNFKNVLAIEKTGENNIILDYICMHDKTLSSYASSEISVLSELKEKVKLIKMNWNNYKEIKYELILKKVNEYLENTLGGHILTEGQLIYYAAKKLGIEKELQNYDGFITDNADEIISELYDDDLCNYSLDDNDTEEDMFYNNISLNIGIPDEDIIHIKNIEKIMLQILNGEVTEESDLEKSNSKNIECKILKFELKPNKNTD